MEIQSGLAVGGDTRADGDQFSHPGFQWFSHFHAASVYVL
jgi:hypothetical protein